MSDLLLFSGATVAAVAAAAVTIDMLLIPYPPPRVHSSIQLSEYSLIFPASSPGSAAATPTSLEDLRRGGSGF